MLGGAALGACAARRRLGGRARGFSLQKLRGFSWGARGRSKGPAEGDGVFDAEAGNRTKAPADVCPAGAEAYATILKPYHGWMISKVVGSAMSSAPKKEVILDRLGHPDKPLTDEEAKAQLAAFVTPMKALVTKISDFLEKEGCNFPDKA